MKTFLLGLGIRIFDFVGFQWNRTRLLALHFRNLLRKRLSLPSGPQTVLIVRFASMGDVVRATAIVEEISRRYANPQIDFLTHKICAPVLEGYSRIRKVILSDQLEQLEAYDWIINLQYPDPPEGVMTAEEHRQALRFVSEQIPHRFMTGRRFEDGRERRDVDVFYCHTEFEEIYLTALLPYNKYQQPRTVVYVNNEEIAAVAKEFEIDSGNRPSIGIGLGMQATSGYDRGHRTYSMEYLESLIRLLGSRYNLFILGQSSDRSADEMAQFRDLLARNPDVRSLVDRTELRELIAVLKCLDGLIIGDTGPLHLAMAADLPVVGLFLQTARFRISFTTHTDRYALLNAEKPGYRYTWRWKYFDSEGFARYYQGMTGGTLPIENIPIETIDASITRLVQGSH